MRVLQAVSLTLTLTWACSFGARLASFTPARNPEGVTARVVPGVDPAFSAELLDVRNDGLLLLASGRVTSIPWGRIVQATFKDLGVELVDGKAPGPSERERVRLASRYPQHLSPELLQALLAACGQNAPDEVR